MEGQVREAREGETQAKDSLRRAEMENRRLRQVVDILKTAVISRSTIAPSASSAIAPPASKQEILKKTGGNAGAFDPFGGMAQVGVHACFTPHDPVIMGGQVVTASPDELSVLAEVVAAAQSAWERRWDYGEPWELDRHNETDDLIERFNLTPWLSSPNPKRVVL